MIHHLLRRSPMPGPLHSLPLAALRCAIPLSLTLTAPAGTPPATPPPSDSSPWTRSDGPLKSTFSLSSTIQGSVGSHAFWGLADTFAPSADYPDDHAWLEGFLRPGLASSLDLSDSLSLYSGLAAIASGTAGNDYFMVGSTGRILMEDAFLGIKWKHLDHSIDLSAGMQPFTLAHSLLLGVGAGNGFERGAAATFPRRSWEMSTLLRLNSPHWSLDGFYLDANELQSSNTGTTLAGTSLKWSHDPSLFAGLAWFKVTSSSSPYPKAPATLLENAREGLETFDFFWKYAPTTGPLAGFSFLGESAIQRQPDINLHAFGAGLEIGYQWSSARFSPRISYSPRYFSGDNPDTPDKLERFDPLFFDGGPATWSSGSNSSFAFYNSNVVSHRFRLELTADPRNLINLNYWFTLAAETNSPIQFGQAARIIEINGTPAVISGVPSRGLSHDFWLEHTHIFNPNWFLTWGVALSLPGDGIRSITRESDNWWGGLLNVTCRF